MTGIPNPRSRSAGPIPESCSSCGDCRAPAERTISRPAAALSTCPSLIHSTPVATRPSNSTRRACAPVITVRLARCAAGPRKADFELAEAAMILALAAPIAFVTPEIGQQVAIAPAHSTQTFPVIEILMLTANKDQAVDRRRAAEHPAARPDDGAAARRLVRFGDEQPGEPLVVDRSIITDRKLEPEIAVSPARLQQQHAAGRISRQPVREHAACRA